MIKKFDLYLKENKSYNYSYKLVNPNVVSKAVREVFKLNKRPQELFVVFGTDSKGNLTSAFEVNQGNVNTSLVDIKSAFSRLLLSNSAGFFIAHNHPSGDTEPSKADHDVTESFKKASKIFELEFFDHIIIGKDSSIHDYSFFKNGEL